MVEADDEREVDDEQEVEADGLLEVGTESQKETKIEVGIVDHVKVEVEVKVKVKEVGTES